MINDVNEYLSYLFYEYIGLIIAMLGLFIVYSKYVWNKNSKSLFYLGYILLIIGTILFIYRIIF